MTLTLLLLALPFFATCLVWIVGRAILHALRAPIECEALPILIGTAASVLVVANLSFAGMALSGWAVALTFALAGAFIVSQRRAVISPINFPELAALAGIVFLSSFHFLLPAIIHGDHVALLEAGDFVSYSTMGSWLQHNPLNAPIDTQTAFNPVLLKVLFQQQTFLRPGALFLLSLYGSGAGLQVPVVYSSYLAWLVALNAVAMYLLITVLSGKSNILASTVVAVLYGLSPILTWSAYASFLPQALGFALVGATLAFFVRFLSTVAAAESFSTVSRTFILPLAILIAALWSAYPELSPVLICILGLYLLVTFYRQLRDGSFMRRLLTLSCVMIAAWFVLSPMSFLWGVRGMIVQLAGTPHGGEQIISAYTLVRTMLTVSLEPLIPASLDHATLLTELAAPATLFCAAVGVAHRIRNGQAAFVFSVSATAVFLFSYVAHHYSLPRYSDLPDGKALLTWNEFKAAQYMVVPLFAIGFGGLIDFATNASANFRNKNMPFYAVAGIALLMAPIIVRQDQRVLHDAYLVRFTPEMRALSRLASSHLLFDLGSNSETSAYLKWALYSLLPSARTASISDGPPLSVQDLISNETTRSAFLGAPFEFILTKYPLHYPNAKKVVEIGEFILLDVRSTDFWFVMNGGGQREKFLNIHSRSAAAAPTLIFYDLATSSIEIMSNRRTYNANNTDQPVTQIAMPELRSGGVVQIALKPPQHGLVPIISDAPVLAPHIGDLKPVMNVLQMVSPDAVPSEPSGDRILDVASGADGVRLRMERVGFGRAILRFHLMAGEYFLRFVFGNISAHREQPDSGYGAYIGTDNRPGTAVDLDHAGDSTFYYRFVLDHEASVDYSLGFGAWGAASGTMSIKAIELLKR